MYWVQNVTPAKVALNILAIELPWLALLFTYARNWWVNAIVDIDKVWLEYESSLKGFLHKNISDPNDVEDVLQEVLIKTYKSLPKLRDNKKIKPWLFQIASNTIIDFYRRRKVDSDISEYEFSYTEPEQKVLQQLSKCIIPFINALPRQDADLLTAIEINGLTKKEFAEKIGVNYSTLKSRVQKSRKALFGLFDECCSFSIDSQGQVMDYHTKKKTCTGC